MKQNMKNAIGLSLKKYNETYMKQAHDRIDNIVAQAGTDNTEIVDARIDSAGITHTTLNNRILAETKMNDEQLVTYTGSYISAEDTMQGYLKDVEIKGNTIQNEEDLADIKSVGELQEDGTYKMSISSCGKNLLNLYNCNFSLSGSDSTLEVISSNCLKVSKNTPNAFFTTMLKLKPNTTYRLSFVKTGTDQSVLGISNSSGSITEQNKTTTLSDGIVKLYARASGVALAGTEIFSNIQLEEGTQATPYEPYQENKCDILLPCQLEKVGDVSDRLYYDDVEKAWCVEKNVGTDMLETYDWQINRSHTNCIAYQTTTQVPNMAASRLGICLGFITNFSWEDSKHYHNGVYGDVTRHIITIPRTEAETPTALKQYLSSNNIYAKYQLATPQKIVLPLDVQIQLNSFFGTTHIYTESGEVEGTIKCKIPKSLGATVQSLNNKTDILSDRIEAIEGLKDSQNMKYETDKGYLVCKETKNGVIDDLKIEGKTLVNLAQKNNLYFKRGISAVDIGTDLTNTISNNLNDRPVRSTYKVNVKPNTKYTILHCNTTLDNYHSIVQTSNNIVIEPRASWINSNLITTSYATDTIWVHLRVDSNDTEFTNVSQLDKHLLILEGDHTQNPPSYFEGLMSVGQDVDKIEVLSRKEDGNLVEYIELNGVNSGDGGDFKSSKYVRTNYITVEPNQTYYIKLPTNVLYSTCVVYSYNSNKSYLGYKSGLTSEFTTVANTKFIRIDLKKADGTDNTQEDINNCDFVVSKYRVSEYIPYQSDKKQILFYNENGELEPVTELHEWDSIEKHSDNKWYYHKRSGKVVLNGSENWGGAVGIDNDNFKRYQLKVTGIFHRPYDIVIISDKFKSVTNKEWTLEEKKIEADSNFIYITTDILTINEFKQWLQANNVTVVYQLAQEEVYELAPLHLDSYANETLILCNSGAISPKMEFSITSHINELVKAYGERINLLEEKVYKYMVTQNRMQLASTYSADSVTFKVDYFSLCGDEENYNEDLYNLILNNILVGKDNYDYDKMFTMILDYASWNQISWEQFDILVGLMDIQHNPPIEELPPEDVIEEDIIENETPVE